MPSGPLPLSCSGFLNALCALTVSTSFSIGPHLSFHWLLLFYLSRFPLCSMSVLVLLTMNSRLQTPEFLRVWGLCRADIPHTEQSLACFQVHIVLGITRRWRPMRPSMLLFIHCLQVLGPQLPSAGKGTEPGCPRQDWACSSVNTGWAEALCHFQNYSWSRDKALQLDTNVNAK